MKYGFNKEEYAESAALHNRTWDNTDEQDRTWRQEMEMLLANVLQHEGAESSSQARTFAAQAAIDLRHRLNFLINELSRPLRFDNVKAPTKMREAPPSGRKVKLLTERTMLKIDKRRARDADFTETTLDDVRDIIPSAGVDE